MPCKCSEIVEHLELLAPPWLGRSWDNNGLLLGDREKEVRTILVALDVSSEVVREAVERKADMIVSHHPLIFKPLESITKDRPSGSRIMDLISSGIAVYSAHTNLDMAEGGVNDSLASALKLNDVEVLQPLEFEPLKKIAVFVPNEYVDKVRESMSNAGAGHIGNYSDCCFMTEGTGTFRPQEGTSPYIGEKGRMEKVRELRVETVVPQGLLDKVVKAMLDAHPYEEVAYDVYTLDNSKRTYGFVKYGKLARPIELNTFAENVKKLLGVRSVRIVGDRKKVLTSAAVSSGSYSGFARAAKEKGADVIVTGDLKYHDACEIADYGLCAVDAGHFATENVIIPVIIEHILKLDKSLMVDESKNSRDIFDFV